MLHFIAGPWASVGSYAGIGTATGRNDEMFFSFSLQRQEGTAIHRHCFGSGFSESGDTGTILPLLANIKPFFYLSGKFMAIQVNIR